MEWVENTWYRETTHNGYRARLERIDGQYVASIYSPEGGDMWMTFAIKRSDIDSHKRVLEAILRELGGE